MPGLRLVLVLSIAAFGCGGHRGLAGEASSELADGGNEPAGSAADSGANARVGSTDAGPSRNLDTGDAAPADDCADLPNACTEPSVSCDGDSLETCARNDRGCLVITRQNCAGAGTSFCNDRAEPPRCEVDPCAALPNACDSAGTSCSGSTLVRCAENGDGCLVATRTDCTTLSGDNACDGSPAECRFDRCRDAQGMPKRDVCATQQDTCAGVYWIHCVADGDGCPIATRTDCTRVPNKNFCDPSARACGFDPCQGVTNCSSAGVTCEGVNRVECTPNADACLVRSVTDCTQNQTTAQTCDASSATPRCSACRDDASCAGEREGDTLCDGNVFQRCSDTDGDTCLNAVREDCGASFSCDREGCVYSAGDTCRSAIAATLRAAMSYGPFDTNGAGNDYSSYACQSSFFTIQATSPDLLFAVDVAARSVATIALAAPAGFTGNPLLLSLSRCADDAADAALTAEASCRAASNSSLSYANDAETPVRIYVVVDANRTNNTDSVGTFGLTLDTRPLVCGDGQRDGAEACDDGNRSSGDGCTPECTLEQGFMCTSNNPSICTLRPSDGICANVLCPALPADAPADSQTCCTSDQRCGIAYDLVFGAGCLERDQPGRADDACADEPSVFPLFFPALSGCCRPDNKCGLMAATGAGCVERGEAWADMAEGLGGLLFPGPFDSASCSYE